MLFSLRGTITHHIEPATIVLDVSGVGFEVYADSDLFHTTGEVQAFVVDIPSEDEHRLYGFLAREKRELFNLLRSVTGIGPKTAMRIISHADAVEMIAAIVSEDVGYLCSLPSIGKRTAERVVLELQNKRKELQKVSEIPDHSNTQNIQLFHQALEGLEALGYPSQQARKVLRSLTHEKDGWTVESLVKAALKQFLDVSPIKGRHT